MVAPTIVAVAWLLSVQPPPPALPPARDNPGATPGAPTTPPPTSAPTPSSPAPPAPSPPDAEAPGPSTVRDPAPSTPPSSPNPAAAPEPGPGFGPVPPPAEPPQPRSIVEPPPPAATPPGPGDAEDTRGDSTAGPSDGTAAPAMSNDNPRLRPSATADPDAPREERPPIAPPPRPRWSGIGLWSAAGVTSAAAIGQHVGSHVIVRRECIDPIDTAGGIDEADTGTANSCYQGAVPGVALSVLGDLSLGASVGLSAAGAGVRARRDAYDDRFADRPARDTLKLEIAGASLLGAGTLMFVTTAAATWGAIAACEDGECVNRLRIVNLSLRNVAGAMGAAGAGMLTYGVLYRRRYFEYGAIYRREAPNPAAASLVPSLAPMLDGRGASVSLSGRF